MRRQGSRHSIVLSAGQSAQYVKRRALRRMLVAALGLVLLLAAAGLLVAAHSGTASSSSTGATRGTVSAVQPGSPDEVIVHSTVGSMAVIVTPHILTSDGSALPLEDVRPGDTALVHGNRVVDLSQTRVTLQGLVAVAPMPLSTTMIVQLRSGLQILVDLDSTTRINGLPANPRSPVLIVDADEVQLVGVFDSWLGEMTRTERIAYSTP